MAASAYNIINQLQNSATDVVGVDVLWCRATPEPNSEDIILQEYTLTNIGLECPKVLKVITANGDYQGGNLTIDLFGVNYESPLEVNVTIEEWNKVYGNDTMPQQGDVVYVKILHKLFEVKSSTVIYTIASMPTYYKCQLSKYNPVASRKETDEFKLSIDELTVSQEELFGDKISQEVADTVAEVETSYNHTTYVDPLKDFDLDSVVHERLIGPDGNVISNAYYDFNIASSNVTYHVSANYYEDSERPHWIYTCWFRNPDNEMNKEYNVKSVFLYLKDKQYWYFKIGTPLRLYVGDLVTLKRGTLISAQGEVCELPNEITHGIRFKAADMVRLNRKLSNWWETGSFKISKSSMYSILNTNNDTFSIDMAPDDKQLRVTFGKFKKNVTFTKDPDFTKWTYMCLDFTSKTLNVILSQLMVDGNGKLFMKEIMNKEYKSAVSSGDFGFESLSLNGLGSMLNIRNIRLYENEYPIDDKYKMDMFSEVTRNASKLILVDGPNVADGKNFISPAR